MNTVDNRTQIGRLEVITGCMFAGKTEALIQRVKEYTAKKKKIVVFKPEIDNRYSVRQVVSHVGTSIESIVIKKAKEILNYIQEDTEVVAIDEVQFMDETIIPICDQLVCQGVVVIVAGLDTDFKAEPFKVMSTLLSQAESVMKLTAICAVCGAPATRTQRLVKGISAQYDDPIVMVGAKESYEARCRCCHEVLNKPKSMM